MTTATALLAAARRSPNPDWKLTLEVRDHRGINYVAGRLAADFGVQDSRGRAVGGEAVIYTQYRMIPNPELVQNGGTKDYGMTMVMSPGHEVVGWEVRIYSARNGKHFGAIPRSSGTFEHLDMAQRFAEQKLDLKARQTRKAASKTGGTYLTDGERRKANTRQVLGLGRPLTADEQQLIRDFTNRHED